MPPFIPMIWTELLSNILGNVATVISVVAVMSQYLKHSHRRIGEEAVKWNNLDRDLAHLKRTKEAYTTFAQQVDEELQEMKVALANIQGQITIIDTHLHNKEASKKLEIILNRVAKLETENRLLLAEKFGMQST